MLAIVRRRDVASPSPGPTLIDAVTYFSWLLQVGATGILSVYAAVGWPARFSRLAHAEAPSIATSRPARRGRDGCGRGDGVLRAARDLPLGAVRDAVREPPRDCLTCD
jgi:hypothetical protein